MAHIEALNGFLFGFKVLGFILKFFFFGFLVLSVCALVAL